MNPFDLYPGARKAAYFIQWLSNLILGIVSIVLVALGENPMWWIITQAVFNFIWSYTGLTAQANVSPDLDDDIYDLPTEVFEAHGGEHVDYEVSGNED